MTGTGGAFGSIDYSTGSWSINLAGIAPADGVNIVASYSYTIVGSSGSQGADSGATGIEIFSFTVFQNGENITITDNNGSTYEGQIGNTQVSDGSNTTTPTVGTTVVMQFTAVGISAAGLEVTMVGTFQGVVLDSTGNQLALSDRRMLGTWIETGGRTGDINGEAAPIQIIVIESTETTETI